MNLHLNIIAFSKRYHYLLKPHFGMRSIKNEILLNKYLVYQRYVILFLSIKHITDLTLLLKCSKEKLENLINIPTYHHFDIAKKRGGKRAIFAPSPELKSIQKHLNAYLQFYYLWIKPAEVFGFTLKLLNSSLSCNIVENAKIHVGKKYLLNFDIKDFFSSISAFQIYQLLRSEYFQFEEEIAKALALLFTYEKSLPMGAPTSPVLSNFICLKLDYDFKLLAASYGLNYSRYADDISFSSNQVIDANVILDSMSILKTHGFNINKKKIRMKSNNKKQVVTGIIVNEKINVPRAFLKKTRAMLHDFSTNGLLKATIHHFKITEEEAPALYSKFINRIQGNINFIGQVRGLNDEIYLSLKIGFEIANQKKTFWLDYGS